MFGFIVGASVKNSYIATSDNDVNQPKVECTASDSMSQLDLSAIVGTVKPDTTEMNFKNYQGTETKRDTVQKTIGGVSTNRTKPAIQNDS